MTAVGGRDVIIKKITMDRMKETEAREVIRWEAEQHVPFDMENVELDFQILDPEGDGLQMTVLLVAAKRELIEYKVALLAEVGLSPASSTWTRSRCTTRSSSTTPRRCAGVVGLVNIGHEITNINILDDGVPVLTRDIPVGTRRFREDLQRERGLSADEADAAAPGLRGERPHSTPLLETPRRGARGRHRARRRVPPVGQPVGRRDRPDLHHRRRRPDSAASTEVLADRLRIPVQLANPIEKLQVADGVFDSMHVDEVAPLLMLPIGLALRTAA